MSLYRWLLHLYPSSFQAEYGDEMSAIFALEWERREGIAARSRFWLSTVAEVVVNAGLVHWEIARRDLLHSARSLLRSPGFTLTAVLLVTIGIGANLAVFTLANFVLVRPLPFPEPNRLVKVWGKQGAYSRWDLSPANFRDVRATSTSFSALAAFNASSMSLVGQGEPRRIDGASVTANLFNVLQAPALFGRSFAENDGKAGAPGTVVLSYTLWQTAFGGDRDILGRSISLDDQPYTVIGVMPADFLFPTRETFFWTPYRFEEEDYQNRTNNYLAGIGRLKPGVSGAQAGSELSVIAAQLQHKYPKENEDVGLSVVSLRDEVSTQSRVLLGGLCGAALCVLVIACANLANLVLARSLARRRELSIRLSLGANRRNLLRQLLTESLLLGIAGGASATAVAIAALPLFSHLVPNALPVQQAPPIDGTMLSLALGLTILTVAGFGAAPALQACRGAGSGGLKVGTRNGGAGHHRARAALVMAEVGASVVLLVVSGLLLRALWRVQAVDPGFRTSGILTLRTQLPNPKYDKTDVRKQFYNKVLTSIRSQPGVKDAAYTSALPMVWGGGIWPVQVNGRYQSPAENNVASMRFVTPEFFATLGIPIQSGRGISESDTANRPYIAVVSESLVQRNWPHQQPIGQHFTFAFHDWEIVGVVPDIHVRGLERSSEPQVYLSYQQVADGWFSPYTPRDLVIHSTQPVDSLVPAVREIVRTSDSELPITNIRTMEEVIAGQTESRTIQMRVLVVFTGVAVLLAGLGIYGLLAFTVSMRQQEFGIRVALGADQKHIFKIVLAQGGRLALAGLAPGLVLAYIAAKLIQSLLAGVQPADALTFSFAAALCLVTALLGTLLPALRAVRTDPTVIMRAE
ncbi:MAG: ABC transporter permease [Acidobacteriaceae bacterium]